MLTLLPMLILTLLPILICTLLRMLSLSTHTSSSANGGVRRY